MRRVHCAEGRYGRSRIKVASVVDLNDASLVLTKRHLLEFHRVLGIRGRRGSMRVGKSTCLGVSVAELRLPSQKSVPLNPTFATFKLRSSLRSPRITSVFAAHKTRRLCCGSKGRFCNEASKQPKTESPLGAGISSI